MGFGDMLMYETVTVAVKLGMYCTYKSLALGRVIGMNGT